MVVGSSLTPVRSRRTGSLFSFTSASCFSNAFHSSAHFGWVFQNRSGGAPIASCMAALTVSGTAKRRAGISRLPSNALTELIASAVVITSKKTCGVRFIVSLPDIVIALLVKQCLGLLQIERVEALGEPAIDPSQKLASLSACPDRARATPCSLRPAIWVYSARNALILSAPSAICAIPLRWPFGPGNVPLSTDVPAPAIF